MLLDQQQRKKRYNDIAFAIVFYLSIVVNIAITIFGLHNFQKYGYTKTKTKNKTVHRLFKYSHVIFMLVCCALSSLFSILWVSIMSKWTRNIIKISLILQILLLIGFGVYLSVLTSSIWVPIIFLALAAVYAFWCYWVWSLIPFCQALLSTALSAFKQHWSPVWVHLLMSVFTLIIAANDAFSMFVMSRLCKSATPFVIFFQLIFLFWHVFAFANVAVVTSCGVMVAWLRNECISVVKKFTDASTILFGSICFGTLIEAVIFALRVLTRYQMNRSSNMVSLVCLCCLNCLLAILGDIVKYVNSYAFVYVAKDHHSYLESAKDVWTMFQRTGLLSLVNDLVLNAPLYVGGMLLIGVIIVISFCGIGFGQIDLVIVIFACGLSIAIYSVVTAVITAYVKVAFVCWAEDPAAFQVVQPAYYSTLTQSASEAGVEVLPIQTNPNDVQITAE